MPWELSHSHYTLNITYDFENVNLNLDLYLYPHALGNEEGKLKENLTCANVKHVNIIIG